MRSFPVRFSPRSGLAGFMAGRGNEFKLVDAGTIEVYDAEIRLIGVRSRFVFGRAPLVVVIPLTTVNNVRVVANTVSFDYELTKGAPRRAVLWTENPAVAQDVARELPFSRTTQFEAALAEQESFYTRLLRVAPTAYVTPILIGANLLMFAVTLIAGADVVASNGRVLIEWGSNYGPLTKGGEWWRLLTSAFLHVGVLHLAFNMWALWNVGLMVERLYGSGYFLLLYLLAAITGSAASVTWSPFVNSAGASGAVFGVLGALLTVVLNKGSDIPATIVKELRTSTLFFIAFNLFNGFVMPFIDNAAHIGGLVGGGLCGLLLARPLNEARRAVPIWRIATAILLCVGAAAFALKR